MSSLTTRLYRLLLQLYPASFRRSYGRGMTETFTLRLADARKTRTVVGQIFVGVRELSGLVAAAARHRMTGTGPRTARRTPHSPLHHSRKTREIIAPLAQETRLALRRLRKAPGFAAAAVITLGLGIGATSAIFSVVHGVMLRPLAYPESDRLVWVDHGAPGIGINEGLYMARGLYLHYRELNKTLIMVTHSDEMASRSLRLVRLRDGRVESDEHVRS